MLISCHILARLVLLHLLYRISAFPLDTTHHSQAGPEEDTSPSSTVALSVECVDFLGDVHSATTFVKRDLGFAGQIGKYILLSYGDTMYSDEHYSDQFRGMTSDSVALATHDPLVVVDSGLKDGYPPQFCPIVSHYGEEMSKCALGITNVVETHPDEGVSCWPCVSHCTDCHQGILYFLLNHRPNGTDNLKGAGVATVTIPDDPVPYPKIHRLAEYWWDGDKEPRYGDVGAIRRNGYIYAYGHAKDNPWVYLTRVKWQEATKMDCYEYWNGETWQTDRLQTKDLTEKESTFWQVNQGQVIWSNYHNCFLFIYCGMLSIIIS